MRLARKFEDEPENTQPAPATAVLMAPLQITGNRAAVGPLKPERAEEKPVVPEAKPANDSTQLDAAGDSLDRIRQTVASLRASDKRVRGMVDALEAANERAKIEIEAMQARLDAAEMRIALETARADAAEERCRETEARFGQILNSLADEIERSA